MAQDTSTAAETIEDRARHTVFLKKPHIIVAHGHGGGVLGAMYPVMGAAIEERIETPLGFAIHVKDIASTAGPFFTGISIPHPADPAKPRYSCEQLITIYSEDCQAIMPPKPNRILKMLFSNAITAAGRVFDPAKHKNDQRRIQAIKRLCDELLAFVPDDKKQVVERLKEKAATPWLTKSGKESVLKLCSRISEPTAGDARKKLTPYMPIPEALERVRNIVTYVSARSTTQRGSLGTIFMQAAIKAMNTLQPYLGTVDDRLHSPDVKMRIFQERMGDLTLEQCFGSMYFSAFNPRAMSFMPMYSRRENLLDVMPDTPAVTSKPQRKAWDANMATTTNLLAYPPHKMEDGTIVIEKGTIHTANFVISEVVAHKPPETGIISITFSTGHVVTEQMADTELMEYYETGEINERFLDEANAQVNTAAFMANANYIGKDNIFILSPRMSPLDEKEMAEFPSRDITDGSPGNMVKIEKRARKFVADEKEKIDHICQILADNLYLLGKMDRAKYDRVTARIGLRDAMNASASGQAAGNDNQPQPIACTTASITNAATIAKPMVP